jgi:hypothetical protein
VSKGKGGSNGRARGRQQIALLDDVGNPEARRDHDFYETPSWQTRALLRRLNITGPVIECCAGRGAISMLLVKQHRGPVIVNEPFEQHQWTLADTTYGTPFTLDATRPEAWATFPWVDWVVTNPPFNLADKIVPLAHRHARVGVAMLLRLSWFEPTAARSEFLEAHPPTAIISMPRYKYRKVGSGDSVTTGWFIWTKEPYASIAENSVVTRKERDELIALAA